MENIIEVKNLTTELTLGGVHVPVVNDVSFKIRPGEVYALVGESGCGKSMTALSMMRLVPEPPAKIVGGEILFHPKKSAALDLLKLSEKEMRGVRGNHIAMIFQEPMTSLNPVFTIGDQITEAIILHQHLSKKQALANAIEMLNTVGIPNPAQRVSQYPHELSGGMRQRVMIAMALSCKPALLIADEPTTALDVTIQAQILELILKLTHDFSMSLLLITHDLGIVAEFAKQVAVMYAGQIVEQSSVSDLFANPRHPYTKGLLDSIPMPFKQDGKLKSIPGMVPDLFDLPKGCTYQERCERVHRDCKEIRPQLLGKNIKHRYRCFFPYEK